MSGKFVINGVQNRVKIVTQMKSNSISACYIFSSEYLLCITISSLSEVRTFLGNKIKIGMRFSLLPLAIPSIESIGK